MFQRIKKTPTILQMEAVECGSVALAIILAYYKRWIPLDVLRSDCGISRDGSRADNLFKAAKKHGMDVEAYSIELDALDEFDLPAIIHWEFNHFVVLEGMSKRHVYINDPAYGKRILSWDEFDQGFTGVILELKPGLHFSKSGHKPKVLTQLVRLLRQSKEAVGFIVLTTLFLAIPGIAIPGLIKVFIDEILIKQLQDWQRSVLISMVIAALFSTVLIWYQRIMLSRLETKIALVNSADFFWKLLRLPISFFNQRYLGDILNRFQSSDSIAQLVSQHFGINFVNLLLALIYLVVLFLLNIRLTLLVLVATTINILFLSLIAQRRSSESQREIKAKNSLMSTAVSGLQMIETYKASGSERDFFLKFSGMHANYMTAEQQLGWTRDFISSLPKLIHALTEMGILCLGAWLAIQGKITIGTVIAFQLLYHNFSQPLILLTELAGKVQEVSADLFAVEDITRHRVATRYQNDDVAYPEKNQKLLGHVVFDNVSFGYSPLAEPLIVDFSLEIKPRQRVALVGNSGSGKSTIGKLLQSYYEPWKGKILIDGIELGMIPNEIRVNSIASVDQDINLFNATIKDNVTLWDATITDEELVHAMKSVLMHDVIAGDREYGYESMLNEGGANFSGGQRQRLEIARAILRKPSILILDEATSALDAQMEYVIDNHLRQLGCTTLIISHRLSTIRDADEIIVLDEGRLVERGTHQELVEKQGVYYRLLASEA